MLLLGCQIQDLPADDFHSFPANELGWPSGAATDDADAFAQWRGRGLHNTAIWPNRETWDQIRNPDIYGAVSAAAQYPMLTIGIAMLPENQNGTFSECASGKYDPYYIQIGRTLQNLGRGAATVRLGWEANGTWYAWSIGDDIWNYRTCFRRQAQAIRSAAPAIRIDWTMNKQSFLETSVANAYPGDDVVDIIGVDFYDSFPSYPDITAWDADYFSTELGGPRGLGSWLKFALSHGKQLSVPEWGVANGVDARLDNSFFIEQMHRFFTANKAHIAYETYFNLGAEFSLYPTSRNAAASSTYATLWKAPVHE